MRLAVFRHSKEVNYFDHFFTTLDVLQKLLDKTLPLEDEYDCMRIKMAGCMDCI